MSKCIIDIFNEDGRVTFEGATVSEALAMKAEYLLTVGLGGPVLPDVEPEPSPSTPKPSGFLSRVKGGE